MVSRVAVVARAPRGDRRYTQHRRRIEQVTVDADDVEPCSGPDAGDALLYAAFADHGTRERVHLLAELCAHSAE
jgi:hypothetical protein